MLRQPNCPKEPSRFGNIGGYNKSYNVVGNGRDTYVAVNNGGFTINHTS